MWHGAAAEIFTSQLPKQKYTIGPATAVSQRRGVITHCVSLTHRFCTQPRRVLCQGARRSHLHTAAPACDTCVRIRRAPAAAAAAAASHAQDLALSCGSAKMVNSTVVTAANGALNGTGHEKARKVPLHPDVHRMLFTPEQIAARVDDMGRQLADEYQDLEPVFLVVLTGAFMFASDLLKAVHPVPKGLKVEFIRVSSYGHGTASSGELLFKSSVEPHVVKGRHVVVVEDIVDSGFTLHQLQAHLKGLGVASAKCVTLLDKKARRVVDYNPDYSCFECPNEFVVGYGLDFADHYRSLPYVGVLKEQMYKEL